MDEQIADTATGPVSQGSLEPAADSASVSATPAVETPAAPQEESFIDPSQLPEELKPHWKRMHTSYIKYREDLKKGREAATTIQRFYSDPDYQLQVLQQAAAQRGLRLSSVAEQLQAQGGQTSNPAVQAPADMVERIKAGLAPELQWMAQNLANSTWAAVQPLIQEKQREQAASKEQEYEAAGAALSQKFPGWEAEEDTMNDLLEWMQSGPMQHPRYGNRLERLYQFTQFVNGHNGHAVQEAATRMAEAARSRTTSSRVAHPGGENFQERIRKATTKHEAFELAQQQAIEELKRQGVAIPD
jgi:DNA-binding transcriptional MerR regulator